MSSEPNGSSERTIAPQSLPQSLLRPPQHQHQPQSHERLSPLLGKSSKASSPTTPTSTSASTAADAAVAVPYPSQKNLLVASASAPSVTRRRSRSFVSASPYPIPSPPVVDSVSSSLSRSPITKPSSDGLATSAPSHARGFVCDTCGKKYKHGTCLSKHRWEHTDQWKATSKLSISKHQQVQLLEAASVLVGFTIPGAKDQVLGIDVQGTDTEQSLSRSQNSRDGQNDDDNDNDNDDDADDDSQQDQQDQDDLMGDELVHEIDVEGDSPPAMPLPTSSSSSSSRLPSSTKSNIWIAS
eukprot:jgi/Hompol1/3642/HPOL_000274-RA